ncbi:MAG TPA: DNA repair protein RecO [Candidatus Krumholzibacteria bacterium]|nr:DNA repair protein RecO [Candidatus Krumholzibacteria bacterium]HPD71243.1 DNA repair protein RecO [Candidatus Krumholzibacteria bacterium]HRY39057.1 DNA repair protein RecO [Candidatus Krumholzibacteria bacterium]
MSLLPRPAGSGRGLVLRVWPSGETSVIASVLSPDHGLLRLMAKGARQTRSRLRPLVQPGRLADLEYSLDPARELQYLRGGSLILDPLAAAPTLERSAYLQAALEIVDRCRPGHGHEAGLFALCQEYVQVLSCADAGCEAALFYAFEAALLDLQGIRPLLEACTQCGRARSRLADRALWLSPAAGGVICAECAAGGAAAGARPLSEAALAAWPELAAAPVSWPTRPLARSTARDWGVMLHRFLEYHLPGYRLPAALDLLRLRPGPPPPRRSD